MEKAEGNKDFPGDLEAIRLDLEDLVEQAKDDFADPEALKKSADEAGYYFMSSHENVSTSQQHAVFGAISAAKAKISATTSFPPAQPDLRKSGSKGTVDSLSSVYDAASMGDALQQAIENTEDTEERRGFKKLLVQWQHARGEETAESPPDAPVTDADGQARPVHHPVHQKSVQGILDAVEIESF
jgi:hypothetical protein